MFVACFLLLNTHQGSIVHRLSIDFIFSVYFQKEDEYDVRMLIHQSLAGCVIGKGGSKIKEIRDVSENYL